MDLKQKAFLDLIAWSEGTSLSELTKNAGYDVIVSGVNGPSVFTDYSEHPFEFGGYVTVRNVPTVLLSTAAGRYQILARYWRAYKNQLTLADFSPASQDAVALEQIKERSAFPLIEAGNIQGAIEACSNIWASFPGNDYGQGGRSMESLLAQYQTFLEGEGNEENGKNNN